MANAYFRFKLFTVWQERCAMKVGTDGTLLGAWARGGRRVLDIGTGTGLVALMMAQRFPEALVAAIDIDDEAVAQARENVAASPFAGRIGVTCHDARQYDSAQLFDAIVSNPPFFDASLLCSDERRTLARHATALTYAELFAAVRRLLADDGEFSVVVPSECKGRMESEAALAGFFMVRECAVKTTPTKAPRRYLMAFRKHPASLQQEEGIVETAPGQRSAWYVELTKDFYL